MAQTLYQKKKKYIKDIPPKHSTANEISIILNNRMSRYEKEGKKKKEKKMNIHNKFGIFVFD